MDGILNVLKPPGMTSFDVVAHLRGLTGIRKIGHAGTLDPLATGVLPVCTGLATRAIEFLMDKDKYYRAELTLGVTTDTQDSSGRILSSVPVLNSDEEIIKAVISFMGKYPQMPPMYSALKVDGKRLYELAREGTEIERQHRVVEVYSAEVLDIKRSAGIKVLLDVHCSKGTYIRTLCADIGERLKCGGHMSFLLRKRAGPFDIGSAFTLEELQKRKTNGTLSDAYTKVEKVFSGLSAYKLEKLEEKKFCNGMQLPIPNDVYPDGLANSRSGQLEAAGNKENLIRVYDSLGEFIALGEVCKRESDTYLKVKKFFKLPVAN